MNVIARRVVVRGRVQGVCFRDGCRREARDAGVCGWVRNEPDGSVSALFEGPADAVEAMIEWARSGPPGAVVDDVEVIETGLQGEGGFRVRG